MTTFRIAKLASVAGFFLLAATSHAAPILGCNESTGSDVDCATIFSASSSAHGISFHAGYEYHVGYKEIASESAEFVESPLNVSAPSVGELDGAEQARGAVVEFDAEASLTGLVLADLASTIGQPSLQKAAAETDAKDVSASEEKVVERSVDDEQEYTEVDFGSIVAEINTLLVSSGGGLPGLSSGSSNIAYLITQVSEPGSALLVLTGFGFLALRRYLVKR
ncbi:MAG: hypothetical protein AB8G18_12065 [Gammaproteobacteria bacterium]